SPAVLGELALAARDRERIRVRYTDGTGRESTRRIEPHALALADHRWFLLCWHLDRDDWRTFRVDRIESIDHTRVIFTPRDISDDEVAERLLIASSWAPQRIEADVVM